MLKIVIVDDELLERKALRKIIQDHLEQISIVGEAANGRIAIEVAEETKPDLILMDIKMPGIDGVEAVKQIRSIDPNIRFIMISAYDTFEYAKEVMRQGVKEYLLKPSSKQDLIAAIERVRDEIMAEKSSNQEIVKLKQQFDKALTLAQTKWVASLLYDQIQNIQFEDWSELLGFHVHAGYAVIFHFHAPENVIDNCYSILKMVVKEKANREVIVGNMENGQVPVLFFTKETMEKDKMQLHIRTIVHVFQHHVKNATLYAGIGHSYPSVQDLSKSFHEAAIAVHALLANKKQQYGFAPKQANPPLEAEASQIEKQLMESIRQGDLTQALYYFPQLVNNQRKLEDNVKRAEEMFILAAHMLKELGIDYQRKGTFHDCQTNEALWQEAKLQLTRLVQFVHSWRNSHSKGVLVKAKEYIDAHYHDALTLEEVAEYSELSPYYFSKIFKERLGISFIDYLTEVRIGHAKRALLNPRKSLKEICYLVGYKDPNYFSRVFKKHAGLSPSEYRKKAMP
ncbi:response regulator transcription factor [Neobacillus mesonae]|uniref:response regulator transcription factor n=1 Tax=Neobacillus mesonae TaxID=1193713 RepID=UPI002572CD45|nr:response regulator transcription factor [Neobacillus mesonae]MED4203590.1 response regulator transcription factor [Neobacillus mesonae]